MDNKEVISVSDLINTWLRNIKADLKSSAHDSYYYATRTLDNYLGSKNVLDLTEDDLNTFLLYQEEQGWHFSTLNKAISVIRMMIEYGNNNGIIKDFKFKPLKFDKDNSGVKALTADEAKVILNVTKNSSKKSDLAIQIALFTSLRIGEICALKWKDIDFKNNVIHVKGTVYRIRCEGENKQTKLVVQSPKTRSSKRDVPIPNELYEILLKLDLEDEDFIITGSDKIPEPRNIQRRFNLLTKKHLGKKMNFHCLRHTFVTLAMQNGAEIKVVSSILGHASVVTTMNIYRSVTLEDKSKTVDIVEKVLTLNMSAS